ncbi:hypothetical protein ABIA99_007307 [Bradyrhizobium sp. LB12.1]|uniref:hypothetical protein n=1 Tax=Bradyrhizobium sp. LB12.1 TaxID=3156327 RepID=UPI00339A9AA0
MTKSEIKPDLGSFGPIMILTLEERVALAAASIAIHSLPHFLQQASDAADMQAMLVDPSCCWRGGYILSKALTIYRSFSGFREGGVDHIESEGKTHFITECEKLISRALKQGKVSNSDDRVFDHGDVVTVEPFPNAPKQAGMLCGMVEGRVKSRRKAH